MTKIEKKRIAEFNELCAEIERVSTMSDSAYIADYADHCLRCEELARLEALTTLERNMIKRLTTESNAVKRSMFKKSLMSTQSAMIDEAFTEYHSLHELTSLLELSEARIVSHKRHLLKEFKNTCRIVYDDTTASKADRFKRFKFELI